MLSIIPHLVQHTGLLYDMGNYGCTLEESLGSEGGSDEDNASADRSRARFSSAWVPSLANDRTQGISWTYHTFVSQELAEPSCPFLGGQTQKLV